MLVPVVALVDIGPDNIWAVLLAAFLLIAAIALVAGVMVLWAKRQTGPDGTSSWNLSATVPMPTSKATFDRLSDLVAKGLKRPPMTAETQSRLNRLDRLSQSRVVAVRTYRVLFAGVGLIGMALAYRLYADATPANMLLLPAGIVALLSAGALLNALSPSRAVTGDIEPIDPHLLAKIHVSVDRPDQTAVTLGQSDVDLASSLFAQGWDADNVARSVVQGYDGFSDDVKAALRSMVAQACGRRA